MASPSADFLLRRPSGSNNERLAAARRAKIDHFNYAHTKSALSHVGGLRVCLRGLVLLQQLQCFVQLIVRLGCRRRRRAGLRGSGRCRDRHQAMR